MCVCGGGGKRAAQPGPAELPGAAALPRSASVPGRESPLGERGHAQAPLARPRPSSALPPGAAPRPRGSTAAECSGLQASGRAATPRRPPPASPPQPGALGPVLRAPTSVWPLLRLQVRGVSSGRFPGGPRGGSRAPSPCGGAGRPLPRPPAPEVRVQSFRPAAPPPSPRCAGQVRRRRRVPSAASLAQLPSLAELPDLPPCRGGTGREGGRASVGPRARTSRAHALGQSKVRTPFVIPSLRLFQDGCSLRSRPSPLPSLALPMPGLMGPVLSPALWHRQPPSQLLAPGPGSLWARWLVSGSRLLLPPLLFVAMGDGRTPPCSCGRRGRAARP